tara:strand:- start:7672 stop:10089 length:2418 start_codon:yes stop_codon:yes gene_type:complete
MSFNFTSKSDTLEYLSKNITKSKIEPLISFTINDWKNNKSKILEKSCKKFKKQKVVVRSSALGEDTIETSNAGVFTSILNVIPSKNTLQKSIERVIKSYNKKKHFNLNNQVIVQRQSTHIKTSGVIFTRISDTGAPYYIINYEDGKNTDSVTKGLIGNSVKISRSTPMTKIPTKWRNLLYAIKEIESILKNNSIDIEFGITNNSIIIFQARPLTTIRQKNYRSLENKIFKIIEKNQNSYEFYSRNSNSVNTIFSDMADWNPSEIIGNNPNLLDYSLYDYLIMSKSWYLGRNLLNYQTINDSKLMKRFGNKPYVDVNLSFDSLIPNNINKKTRKKLLKFYLDKLSNNPFLHDKVEFQILFTCSDPSLNSRIRELKKYSFSNDEIIQIKKSLIDFTNNIIKRTPELFLDFDKSFEILRKNRIKHIQKLNNSKKNHNDYLELSQNLLKDCRKYGVIPFSAVARLAFIAVTILNGLERESILTRTSSDNLLSQIETPMSDYKNELNLLIDKKVSKKKFLEKYGHLRPGTYDITVPRYDMNPNYLSSTKFFSQKPTPITKIQEKKINKQLKKSRLIFNEISFIDFLKKSIIQREKLKFEFTKNLSDSLEYIATAGEQLGFSREEMAYLDIKTILKYNKKSKSEIKKFWRYNINKNNIKTIENNHLHLPSIIFSKNDFEIINEFFAKPNFITSKQTSSEISFLNPKTKSQNLKNKIVIIENADPGYDWIFTKSPSGLITKYGGMASHMAIRCAEIGIPAAIGCGELLFQKLKISEQVYLDCKNQQISIQKYRKNDKFLEEKRILKSLGYIK